MIKEFFNLTHRAGLHARPSAMITNVASKYKSLIFVSSIDGFEADAKDIMQLMCLGINKPSILTLVAEGIDEKKAMQDLINVLNSLNINGC